MSFNFVDRVSTYPNRYKVTRGDGTTEYLTLERADEPTVVGTPLNAETFNNIVNLVYPVGSIYMSVNSTSPESLFGGTWEQLKDRFLLGAGDTYTNGATGGAATVTLTVDEIPAHSHGLYSRAVYSGDGNYIAHCNKANAGDYSHVTDSRGGGNAHENMPPYLVVYMWKRVA